MGVAFIALGISTNRTFLFVGIVFLIIGSARIARSRGSH
jgi:hypothetical protein